MQSQLQDIQSRMQKGQVADPVKLFEEGKRHADMMLEGLNKLPPIKGTVHRGERMTGEESARLWKGKRQIDYPSFVSSTTDPAMADGFAAGKFARPDQTVSIRSRFAVTDARDVQGVSSVPAEKECLILPGTSFTVDKIERSKLRCPATRPPPNGGRSPSPRSRR